jgi:hypothetical protein
MRCTFSLQLGNSVKFNAQFGIASGILNQGLTQFISQLSFCASLASQWQSHTGRVVLGKFRGGSLR